MFFWLVRPRQLRPFYEGRRHKAKLVSLSLALIAGCAVPKHKPIVDHGLPVSTYQFDADGRVLIQDLCRSEADILPDPDNGILNVVVHGMATPRSNRAIRHLLENLNDAQFNYPGTNLRLVYTLAIPDDPKSEIGVT